MRQLVALLILLLCVGCHQPDNGNKECKQAIHVVQNFGKKAAAEHDMQLLFVYNVSGNGAEPYSMSFASGKQLNSCEARKLAISLVQDFVRVLQSSRGSQELEEWAKRSRSKADYSIQTKNVCIKIGFWDKDMNRMMPPHIAELFFFNDTLYYYHADPKTQKRVLVLEESYQDALKCV